MRLVVISIGRLKQGPERELTERYRGKIRGYRPQTRFFAALIFMKFPEAARATLQPDCRGSCGYFRGNSAKSVLVALDERGDNVDSAAFARHLGAGGMGRRQHYFIVIGGADGLFA